MECGNVLPGMLRGYYSWEFLLLTLKIDYGGKYQDET